MFNEGDNEGIVNVKEYFEENNTAYIVMEYLDGTTLRNKVKQQTFTFEETKKIMEPICHALTKIHQFGVVHLDVSPDNIMMLNDGSAKLLDFGGARSLYTDDDADRYKNKEIFYCILSYIFLHDLCLVCFYPMNIARINLAIFLSPDNHLFFDICWFYASLLLFLNIFDQPFFQSAVFNGVIWS